MEQATNQFTKGLQLDTHPMVQSNDTLTDCLNGTLITMNGNEVILQNDMGNRRVDKAFLPPGYEPVGIKEYGGIIYVASYNPITNKSQIGSFPSPQKKLSSNSSGELQEVFDFSSFTSSSNYETDPDLGINVLKSDSVMLPLSNDLSLRAGDKFAVYSSGLSELSEYLTNYNNVLDGKAISPKNRKYTLQLGVLNSQNEFVDITKTLYRWKSVSGQWQPVNYSSEVSETFKFNDGYFISDAFTNSFNEETIADAELIKERQKIAANTYAYKLVGPLYLKASINHIENFNYNIYGIKNNDGTANLWVEGFLTYNCPDGTGIDLSSLDNNSNENYRTFEEGTPDNNFGFDLIGLSPANVQRGRSVYNPNTNTYTVKIVKKYINVAANRDGYMFDYVIGVKVDKDTSGVYLKGLSTKGSINLSLLGSGILKFIGWKFYNNSAESTTALTFTFNAYPEYGKQFYNLRLRFQEYGSSIPIEYPELLPIYNGKQTITFNWENLGLSKGRAYIVTATYYITDDPDMHTISEDPGVVRWFITTDLFNEFYPTSAGVADYCNDNTMEPTPYTAFHNKMVIQLENESSITDESSTTESSEGKLITVSNPKISYTYKHTHKIKITTNPILKIKNKDLYPSSIDINSTKRNAVDVSSIDLYQIGNVTGPQTENETQTTRTFNSVFRTQLEAVRGKTYDESNQLWNPLTELGNQTFLEETKLEANGKTISGKVEYYDVYKAYGELIDNISNAFQRFSQLIQFVKPYNGHFGGVVSDFDAGAGDDDHYLEVATSQDLDIGNLPLDHDLPTGWRELASESNDGRITFNIDQYTGSIFQYFNETVKDTDITFLYYFCRGNRFTVNINSNNGQKSGENYTRVWWMMPNGEWAAFRELYYKTNAANGFNDFVMSSLGNKDLVYCMYDNYTENDKIYAPKESYIYYDKYNIPMVYNINYSLQQGDTPSSIVNGINNINNHYGNLNFSVSNNISFIPDKIEFYLQPSDNFYRDINNVDSENISNVCIINGESVDSEERPLNRNYFYYYDSNNGNKLTRIDNSYFYIDTINKTQDGRNRVLYNEHTKGSVSYRYQNAGEDDCHTVIIYNSLKAVKPV